MLAELGASTLATSRITTYRGDKRVWWQLTESAQTTSRYQRLSCISAPSRYQILFDAQVVKHARNHEIDQIGNLFRSMIEARCSRHNNRTGTRETQHVAEMNCGEWSLARHESQLPLLL